MAAEFNTSAPEMELSELLQIRRDKLSELQKAGRDPFQQTRFLRTHWSEEIREKYEELEGKNVSVAGRIMSKRGMGKAIFCHIKDDRGQIQLYTRIDAVTEQEFADLRKYDIGDMRYDEVTGVQTKHGEFYEQFDPAEVKASEEQEPVHPVSRRFTGEKGGK